MNDKKKIRLSYVLFSTLLVFIGFAVYGHTAANNVREFNAGDGTGFIGGFNVSNINYQLDTLNDPDRILAVTFNAFSILPGLYPSTAKISLDGGNTWTNCSMNPLRTSFQCNPGSSYYLSSITGLRIILVQ